jgi:hypothetical protein
VLPQKRDGDVIALQSLRRQIAVKSLQRRSPANMPPSLWLVRMHVVDPALQQSRAKSFSKLAVLALSITTVSN